MIEGSSRLLELLGGLSLASDVVNAFPLGKTVRTALLAADLARVIGEPDDVAGDALYVTLLRYLGCTGFAHEEAHEYGAGDDHSVRTTMVLADAADPIGTLARITRGIAPSASALRRTAAIGRLLGDGVAVHRHAHAQCETSAILARQVGASARIVDALSQICERWDGKGAPAQLEGEAIALPIRLFRVADVVEVVHHREGREAAIETARRRAGAHFEPRIARALDAEASRLFDRIESADVLEHFLEAEPAPHATIDRGLGTSSLAPPARILAVADAMHAMREVRPHRAPRGEDEITSALRDGARAGALDADVVDAALALGGRGRRSPARTSLSDRELEILRWVARGKTNKEIGTILGISPRTVQTHVARVYAKVGIYSRAGAALYVMENGLLESG